MRVSQRTTKLTHQQCRGSDHGPPMHRRQSVTRLIGTQADQVVSGGLGRHGRTCPLGKRPTDLMGSFSLRRATRYGVHDHGWDRQDAKTDANEAKRVVQPEPRARVDKDPSLSRRNAHGQGGEGLSPAGAAWFTRFVGDEVEAVTGRWCDMAALGPISVWRQVHRTPLPARGRTVDAKETAEARDPPGDVQGDLRWLALWHQWGASGLAPETLIPHSADADHTDGCCNQHDSDCDA